jgi:hypothetical protein
MIAEVLSVVGWGDSTDVPGWLGTKARPGSENRAKAHWGSLGTWENRRRPRDEAPAREDEPVNNILALVRRFPAPTSEQESHPRYCSATPQTERRKTSQVVVATP